jgi:hypothetical protein
MSVCANPEDCCRELTRVWEALGNPVYDGRSASEHVAALRAGLPAAREARSDGSVSLANDGENK